MKHIQEQMSLGGGIPQAQEEGSSPQLNDIEPDPGGADAETHSRIDADAIPLTMRELPQWVVWRLEPRDPDQPEGRGNKLTKTPYDARRIKLNGFEMLPNRDGKARSNDPQTWCSFEEAVEVLNNCAAVTGIGFCFSPSDGIVGIDLDHCFDEAGNLLPWAEEIVAQFDGTYIERSPSREGIHILCLGKAIRAGKRVIISNAKGVGEAIEVYDGTSPRYFTVTGIPFRRNL